MVTRNTKFWLKVVTIVQALFAFFYGVYFSVWGSDLTSPVWVFIMSGWHGPRFWGSLLFLSGALFLFGLDWDRAWGRVTGAALTGLIYIAIGIILCVAPLVRHDALSGSMGIWLLTGTLSLCLATFMWQEKGPVT